MSMCFTRGVMHVVVVSKVTQTRKTESRTWGNQKSEVQKATVDNATKCSITIQQYRFSSAFFVLDRGLIYVTGVCYICNQWACVLPEEWCMLLWFVIFLYSYISIHTDRDATLCCIVNRCFLNFWFLITSCSWFISKYKKKTKKADENVYCCIILINTGLW
jgi:hypothetical protein